MRGSVPSPDVVPGWTSLEKTEEEMKESVRKEELFMVSVN